MAKTEQSFPRNFTGEISIVIPNCWNIYKLTATIWPSIITVYIQKQLTKSFVVMVIVSSPIALLSASATTGITSCPSQVTWLTGNEGRYRLNIVFLVTILSVSAQVWSSRALYFLGVHQHPSSKSGLVITRISRICGIIIALLRWAPDFVGWRLARTGHLHEWRIIKKVLARFHFQNRICSVTYAVPFWFSSVSGKKI